MANLNSPHHLFDESCRQVKEAYGEWGRTPTASHRISSDQIVWELKWEMADGFFTYWLPKAVVQRDQLPTSAISARGILMYCQLRF